MTTEEIRDRLAVFRLDIEAGDTSWQMGLIDLLEEVLTGDPTE